MAGSFSEQLIYLCLKLCTDPGYVGRLVIPNDVFTGGRTFCIRCWAGCRL